MCVCVRVCVCVYMCVFISFHCKGFWLNKMLKKLCGKCLCRHDIDNHSRNLQVEKFCLILSNQHWIKSWHYKWKDLLNLTVPAVTISWALLIDALCWNFSSEKLWETLRGCYSWNEALGFTYLPLIGGIPFMSTTSIVFSWERYVKSGETKWKVLKTKDWA